MVLEAIWRVATLGADRVVVGSGQPFYEAVGFRKRYTGYTWTKAF